MAKTREAPRVNGTAMKGEDAQTAVWRRLEEAACSMGSHKDQRRALVQLKTLEPDNADWHAKLGALLVATDSTSEGMQEAEQSIEEALRLNPKHPTALLTLGKLATNEQQRLDFFEAAAASDPNCLEAVEGAASMLWARGSLEQAGPLYRTLSPHRQKDALTLQRAAWGALAADDASDARSLLQRAVHCEPANQEALALLGYASMLLGRTDEGLAHLQAAMRCKDGTRPATRLYWALLLHDCGDARQAEAELGLALASHAGLQSARSSAVSLDAMAAGRVEPAALAQDLPGASTKVLHVLVGLLRKVTPAQAGGPGGNTTPRSGTSAAAAPRQPRALTPTRSLTPPRVLAASPASQQSEASPQPDTLESGRKVEVYSKSAARWIPGLVVLVKGDIVKIKYLIDGALCEKALLRSSDSWRLAASQEESPAAQPAQPARQTASLRGLTPPRAAAAQQQQQQQQQQSPGAAPGAELRAPVAALRPARDVSPRLAKPVAKSAQDAGPASPATPPPQGGPRPDDQGGPTKLAAGRRSGLSAIDEQRSHRSSTPPRTGALSQKPAADLLNAEDLQFGPVLGTGGFGAVYRGTYCGSEVAIKKLHITDGHITSAQLEEFKKEVSNLMALQHPRLISFIGAAFAAPNLCIVTEFMPNGSLYELLHQRRERLAESQRHNIAVQTAEGVLFLHGRNPPFVHRDLKSLNVVLDYALGVKLCDFGLTQTMENTHISRRGSQEGGSPRYMAPELFDSQGKITEKVDVWALGCLIIEIFTGRMPHEECNTIHQVMTKMLIERKLPFTDWSDVCPDLEKLATACFAFSPKRRLDVLTVLDALSVRRQG